MQTWWPEITVDIVQGDLQRMALPVEPKRIVDVGDSEEKPEWTLRPSASKPHMESRFAVFDQVQSTLSTMKRRIDQLRFELCMSTFHSLVVAAAGCAQCDPFVSPLDFCSMSAQLESLPSTTSSVDAYTAAMTNCRIVCAPMTSDVCAHIAEFQEDSSRFTTQDVKDIQRDSVCINGAVLNGCEVGYDSIVDALSGLLDSNDRIARTALSVGNRTFSGGAAFEKVIDHFGADGIVTIAPDSAAAEPIDIVVTNAGQTVLIRGHTKYTIRRDSDGSVLSSVDATLLAELPVGDVFSSRCFVFLETQPTCST